MTNSELITPQHLLRKAIIYVRQSTPHQVLSNQDVFVKRILALPQLW